MNMVLNLSTTSMELRIGSTLCEPHSYSSSSSSSSEHGDESVIHELFDLIQNPYEEGTDEQDLKYYRRAPDHALKAGGTAFMS
mmetsp:Transcript_11399/g.16099  ORF Transcript_11399/g.16099 Transcript_11399/m.16099 type:complete len:83 (+) Transcript_11399:232-480(+)